MARFAEGFQKVPEFDFSEQGPKGSFSILIPFRNEENHLPMLLDSLNAIQYSRTLFEVIFIDDDSTDASVKIIQKTLSGTNISYQIIRNHRVSNSPKKDAIETAIKIAKHEWILTTDADCILPDNWLQVFNEYTTSIDSKMIVGPVIYKTNDSFIENFQLFEFLSLQGATIGGFGIGKPFLCNGANLAYKRQTFLELNGFQGNNNIASGDDIFLFEKFYKKYPEAVHFLKSRSALVKTFPLLTWKNVIHQRMRWAAKSSSSKLWFGTYVGILVFLTNLSWILAVINLFLFRENFLKLIVPIAIKIMVDYYFLDIISRFYKNQIKIKSYIFSSLFYPFFSTFIVFKTLSSKYNWKDRRFKK
tara:strand:- start:26940 stop:28019 length:1080 start_codon:yes stop_codon:yes gene_type:complete